MFAGKRKISICLYNDCPKLTENQLLLMKELYNSNKPNIAFDDFCRIIVREAIEKLRVDCEQTAINNYL